MAREHRVRLSDHELRLVDEAADHLYGTDLASQLPRGQVIGRLAQDYLDYRPLGEG